MSCHLTSIGSSFVLQQEEIHDRNNQICEVKAWIWLKNGHTFISGVEEDSFTSPLLLRGETSPPASDEMKNEGLKMSNSGSFIPQPGNKLLSPGDDDWLQKQISGVVTFCTPA